MAEATRPAPTVDRKSSMTTFIILLSFGAVFLIYANPGIRNALGMYVGYVFSPIIGFHGDAPLWTIFFASLVLILGTTAIRHFLIDWVKMARVQEVMRTFQKEMTQARKDNNMYKMKKLTEKQPEIMGMQAELSTDQMKPMAFTMLLVIPIFAWLSTLTAAPVILHAAMATPGEMVLVSVNPDIHEVAYWNFADPKNPTHQGNLEPVHQESIYAFPIPGTTAPTGTMTLTSEKGESTVMDLSKTSDVLSKHKVGNVSAGTYRFRTTLDPVFHYAAKHTTATLVLVTVGKATHEVHAMRVDTGSADNAPGVKVGEESDVYAVMLLSGQPNDLSGSTDLKVLPVGDDKPVATWTVTTKDGAENLAPTQYGAVNPVPHHVKLPWNSQSDLNGTTVLPHWILLYSLFSIPFGTLTQKGLKLWEYNRAEKKGSLA